MARGVEEYLASLRAERGLAANTIAAYRRDLAQYIHFLSGAEPDAELVTAFVVDLRTRGLSDSSVTRKVAAVRGLHRFLAAEGLADSDPTLLIESQRRPSSVPKALTVEEAIALVEAPDRSTVAGRRDAAIMEFLYGTGARVSEAVSLDLPALDLDEGIAIVSGKGARQRLVPIGSAAEQALRDWLADRIGLIRRPTDAVFVNLRGARLTRQGAFLIVKSAARRAGIDPHKISPHVLRHSAATHMIEGGADLRTVQEILGHANLNTTQVYTRVSPQHLVEVYVLAHPRSR
jgi:integrase/recombinase XerD